MADVTLTASVRQSLLSLQNTQELVGRTQKRLSSGLEVENAIDDAISYFQSKALVDRSTDLLEKKDNIDQGVSTIASALDGVTAIEEIVRQMKGVANSMKSAEDTQMSSLVTTFNELHTQINNMAADATYQGLNLINGTGANLGIEFSEQTASRMDVASVDLRATTAGLDLKNPAGYTQAESVGVLAALAETAGNNDGTFASRFLSDTGSLTLTWNADAATFRAGETLDFTYGTGVSLTLYVHSANDLATTDGGTITIDIVTTSVTATTSMDIYAIATASRNIVVSHQAVDASAGDGAWNNATNIATMTTFKFTYLGSEAITLTTADNGLSLATADNGTAGIQLFVGQGQTFTLTGSGDVHELYMYSGGTGSEAGNTLAYGVAATNGVAYIVATALQGTGFVETAVTASRTESFGINLAHANVTSLTGGDFNLTTASNVALVKAGNTDQINRLLTELNTALTTLRTNSQVLGTNVALLNTRLEFTEDYVNTLQIGSDKMVLADINVEGANLLALQTRQQLGIQSLSLAAQAEASILRLFQ